MQSFTECSPLDHRRILVRTCKLPTFMSTLLTYVPPTSFLLPLSNLLPLINGLKERRRLEGRNRVRSSFVSYSTFGTDGQDSVWEFPAFFTSSGTS
jgi:hypothetical protein